TRRPAHRPADHAGVVVGTTLRMGADGDDPALAIRGGGESGGTDHDAGGGALLGDLGHVDTDGGVGGEVFLVAGREQRALTVFDGEFAGVDAEDFLGVFGELHLDVAGAPGPVGGVDDLRVEQVQRPGIVAAGEIRAGTDADIAAAVGDE